MCYTKKMKNEKKNMHKTFVVVFCVVVISFFIFHFVLCV